MSVEILTGGTDRPFTKIGVVKAKVAKASLFSKSPTLEDVNYKLQEEALRLGANAVLYVSYDRGMSLTSYEVLHTTGTAVTLEAEDTKCPYCAETIKRAAVRCKHCSAELRPH